MYVDTLDSDRRWSKYTQTLGKEEMEKGGDRLQFPT